METHQVLLSFGLFLQNLKITDAEKFLENPFAFIPTNQVFEKTLADINTTGKIQLYWTVNQSASWQTSKEDLNIIYDDQPHDYTIFIPAGGTFLNQIKLSNFRIPGKIIINTLKVIYPSFKEYTTNQLKN